MGIEQLNNNWNVTYAYNTFNCKGTFNSKYKAIKK